MIISFAFGEFKAANRLIDNVTVQAAFYRMSDEKFGVCMRTSRREVDINFIYSSILRDCPVLAVACQKKLKDIKQVIIPVYSIIEEIDNLPNTAPDTEYESSELYADRVLWFKYWSNNCLAKYGKNADLMITQIEIIMSAKGM